MTAELEHGVRFYLGVPEPAWLERTQVPLFVSRVRLERRVRLPRPVGPWALDSGGFTELLRHRRWITSEDAYVAFVERVLEHMRPPDFVAPMDWMCEAFMLDGRTVAEHQRRTVDNFVRLRERLRQLVVPVLQGYSLRDYERCVELYSAAGVDLELEPVVGLGSVCRRSGTLEASRTIRALVQDHRLRLHGFGIKGATLLACAGYLASADSMAWSYGARRNGRDGYSLAEALAWRDALFGSFEPRARAPG